VAINRKELRSNAKRYYAGIKLSADGLRLWETAVASDFFKGKTTSTSNKVDEVNSEIPAQWYLFPSVEAMQGEHASRARKRDTARDPRDTSRDSGDSSPEDVSPKVSSTKAVDDVGEIPF